VEHSRPYWHDKERDLYVIHLKSRKNPVAIPGAQWEILREAYSNWDGAPASINELARKLGLARRTVKEVLKSMETTHDSAPWTDEKIDKSSEDELVEDLLRRKEERVLVAAERKEWSKIKKDAEKYRRIELIANSLALKFDKASPRYRVSKLKLRQSSQPYAVVVSPTDFHWGDYAPGYTKDPYNRKIARKRLMQTTKALMARLTKRGRPQCIYLALGGDGLTIDNQGKTTTRGTLQDVDGVPEELAWSWVELCRDYVDLLRQLAPVRLFVVPGNHDYYTATLLRAAMKGWFSLAKDVTVEESYSNRQYTQYGSSLITFLHGDVGSPKDWPAIIAGEVPKLWGDSQWRFIFCGHLHTERDFPTFGNVTVYRMPSLAGTDAWHHKSGYKSRKSLVCYVVDQKRGVIATEVEPVPEAV
tara:strand:- start:5754 stop:7001 length:1248 start_codon:yes stop_codon:yes gene_type:complete